MLQNNLSIKCTSLTSAVCDLLGALGGRMGAHIPEGGEPHVPSSTSVSPHCNSGILFLDKRSIGKVVEVMQDDDLRMSYRGQCKCSVIVGS